MSEKRGLSLRFAAATVVIAGVLVLLFLAFVHDEGDEGAPVGIAFVAALFAAIGVLSYGFELGRRWPRTGLRAGATDVLLNYGTVCALATVLMAPVQAVRDPGGLWAIPYLSLFFLPVVVPAGTLAFLLGRRVAPAYQPIPGQSETSR